MRPANVLFKKKDLLFIAGLLIIALSFYLWQRFTVFPADALEYVISVNGEEIKTMPLTGGSEDDLEFSIPERPQIIIQMANGAVAFAASDCPDQVCVHTGYINQPGQFAACLPNNVVLQVRRKNGSSPDDPDIVITQ